MLATLESLESQIELYQKKTYFLSLIKAYQHYPLNMVREKLTLIEVLKFKNRITKEHIFQKTELIREKSNSLFF
jgi:hypothetical protein